MGFVGFLKFAFKWFDFVAWPLFGLGCPLYASIRAIENNLNSEMRNLVAYWILFSMVSLFELAFVKLIEWLPFWPYMKLVAMCLLVLPDFNGASYAYECLLRPYLSVDPRAVIKYLLTKKRAVTKYLLMKKRAVIKYFVRSKEEKSLSAESFQALAERYAQENGYEALEKLFDRKTKHTKPDIGTEEIKAISNTEEKETAAAIQSKYQEPIVGKMDARAVEQPEKSPVAPTKLTRHTKPDIGMEEIKAISNTEEKESAAAIQSKYQEPIVGKMDARAVEQPEKSPVAATKLSKVREPSVGKENANLGQLKDENPAVATEQVKFEEPNIVQNEKKTVAGGEIKEKTVGAAGEENKAVEITLEKVQREWTCALCQLTISSKLVNSHLQGRKHKAKFQKLEASKQVNENKGSSSSAASPEPKKTLDVDRPNDNCTKKQEYKVEFEEPNIVQNEKKTVAAGEIKEETVGAADEENKAVEITSEKVQREWTCALCQVTTQNENMLDSHLQGRKHKAKFQKLEASKQANKNKGSSSSSAASPEPKKTLVVDRPNDNSNKKQDYKVRAYMTNEQCRDKEVDNTGCGMNQSQFWCSICDVKFLSEIDWASHLQGYWHLSNTQQHMINAWGGGYY